MTAFVKIRKKKYKNSIKKNHTKKNHKNVSQKGLRQTEFNERENIINDRNLTLIDEIDTHSQVCKVHWLDNDNAYALHSIKIWQINNKCLASSNHSNLSNFNDFNAGNNTNHHRNASVCNIINDNMHYQNINVNTNANNNNSNDCNYNKKQGIDCIARINCHKTRTLFCVSNKDGSMVATDSVVTNINRRRRSNNNNIFDFGKICLCRSFDPHSPQFQS